MTSFTFAGTEIQNGGVGLKIDGKVATFYSSQVSIFPTPLHTIEGMSALLDEIENLSVGSSTKFHLIQSIMPNYERKYYQLDSVGTDDEVLKKIIREYQEKTGIDSKDLTVFGITNPNTKTTLLLNDFFSISPVEKQTILFHESMWISGRVQSIDQMIKLEYFFQQYLENKDAKSTFEFYAILSELLNDNYSWQLFACLKQEMNQEIGVQKLIPDRAVSALAAYALSIARTDKHQYALKLAMELQKSQQGPSSGFYYSKEAFKNLVFKSTSESNTFIIKDREVLEHDYPAESYSSVEENPQYQILYRKLKLAKVLLIESAHASYITFVNADLSEIMRLNLTP